MWQYSSMTGSEAEGEEQKGKSVEIAFNHLSRAIKQMLRYYHFALKYRPAAQGLEREIERE